LTAEEELIVAVFEGAEEVRHDQFIEQAPGPRGSPHAPHGAGAGKSARGPDACAPTANVDSCLLSVRESHDGHAASRSARVRCSKWWPQDWQAYSKIGMQSL
jgi:hypothetical protein